MPALSNVLYHKGQQSDEYTCMRMFSRNLYNCKQVASCVFCLHLSRVVVACLFVYPLFYTAIYCCLFSSLSPYFLILTLLLYFCVFIKHVNKPIIIVFGAFVHHFKKLFPFSKQYVYFICIYLDILS